MDTDERKCKLPHTRPSEGILTAHASSTLSSGSVFLSLSLSARWNAGGSKPPPSPPESLSNCECINQRTSKCQKAVWLKKLSNLTRKKVLTSLQQASHNPSAKWVTPLSSLCSHSRSFEIQPFNPLPGIIIGFFSCSFAIVFNSSTCNRKG